jgi:Mg/Co/Ni transporter MgtE
MKFGGLSEQEVKTISELLEQEGVSFEVKVDEDIEDYNDLSIRNDLRHLTPPNISTHILAVHVQDDAFDLLSSSAREKLLEFGITDQVPDPEDFIAATGDTFHRDLAVAPRRIVAFNFKH